MVCCCGCSDDNINYFENATTESTTEDATVIDTQCCSCCFDCTCDVMFREGCTCESSQDSFSTENSMFPPSVYDYNVEDTILVP